MSRQPAPPGRSQAILHSIVQTYIETGEPVASRTVARRLGENLSPASIRNTMLDLVEEGYLAQPHTSAGRIPTGKAFQSYVRTLVARRLVREQIDELRSRLQTAGRLQDRVEMTSQLLTELSRGMGIAAVIPTAAQTLDQLDLLALPDRKVLIVMVMRDGTVHNRAVSVPEAFTGDELAEIRNYLNDQFRGWALADMQREVLVRLASEQAVYDSILRKLNALHESGLLDVSLTPEVHAEGVANLVGFDLHLTRERMRDLFVVLEQKKRILVLLDRFVRAPEADVAIQVGLSEAEPSMGDLSLIGLRVQMPNGVEGKFAVVGPMRMNYERAISAVLHLGHAFQSV